MSVNMLSNLSTDTLLSFQAVLSEQNLKPDCCETRSREWQKLMHFLN